MKIAYASDIHLELNSGPALDELRKNPPDVVVLAGDIATHAGLLIVYATRLSAALNCHVVFTTGNHEYYDRIPIQIKDKELFDLTKDEDKIHYLQDTHTIIDGVLFVGGTLWTDFEVEGLSRKPLIREDIRCSMNDFKQIKVVRKNGDVRFWTPDYWEGFHMVTKTVINETLRNNSMCGDLPTVVVTHHGAHERLNGRDPYKQNYRAGYVSDLRYIYSAYCAPDFWISGHTHETMEFRDPQWPKTLFCSNCYGYEMSEKEMVAAFEWKFIEVENA